MAITPPPTTDTELGAVGWSASRARWAMARTLLAAASIAFLLEMVEEFVDLAEGPAEAIVEPLVFSGLLVLFCAPLLWMLVARPMQRIVLQQLDSLAEAAAELRRANDQLRQRDAKLEAAAAEAQQANRCKSQFLTHMSHEMRTPLNAVIGFTHLLHEEPDGPLDQRLEWTRTVEASAQHLLSLINNVLDLAKIEAGRLQYSPAPCDILHLLEETIAAHRPAAQHKQLTLTLAIPQPLPQNVIVDATRVRQVVMNLVGNAIKFTETGTVTVTAQAVGEDDQAQLHVTVQDTGIGISRGEQDEVFGAFHQSSAPLARKAGGTGLGLSISRRICEDLGGTLTLQSEEGVGSCFAFQIPAPAGSEQLTGCGGLQADPADPPTALRGRVLVVDDVATNRRLIAMILGRWGLTVDEASDGHEALNRLAEHRYDLVLLDMQMPVMDGYAAAAELRRCGDATPLIALTAHALSGDRQRCLDAGCDDYLAKPVDHLALRACVRRHVQAPEGDAVARAA